MRFFARANQGLKFMVTILAVIFKQRHGAESVYEGDWGVLPNRKADDLWHCIIRQNDFEDILTGRGDADCLINQVELIFREKAANKFAALPNKHWFDDQCVEEFAWTANVFDCESRRDVAYRFGLSIWRPSRDAAQSIVAGIVRFRTDDVGRTEFLRIQLRMQKLGLPAVQSNVS
jgi:hypothetical protein